MKQLYVKMDFEGVDLSSQLWFKQLMVSFRMLYTVGYSLSFFTLLTALIILLSFR